MTRWVVAVLAAVFTLAVVAWSVGWNAHEPKTPRRQVTEAERIITYCNHPDHESSPLCRVDAEDPEQVEDAVRDIIDRPQIIERERETVRQESDDDDDTGPAPQVTVIQPSQAPAPSPSATRPPMQLDIPDIPDVPDLGDVQLPLLP